MSPLFIELGLLETAYRCVASDPNRRRSSLCQQP